MPSKHSMLANLLGLPIVALGVAVTLSGLFLDTILPSASPGASVPQVLFIAAGPILVVAGALLRRVVQRHGLSRIRFRDIAIGVLISLATLIVLEFVLAAVGIPTYFPSQVNPGEFRLFDNHFCNEFGCRMIFDADHELCQDPAVLNRRCISNELGFTDTDEFVARVDLHDRPRVMVMGDSFTAGFAADVGMSYVETLERSLPDAVIWNTGVPGTGTSQDLAAFLRFAPILDPDLSVLGFFVNDFRDNLFRPDHWTLLADAEGRRHWVLTDDFNRWVKSVDLATEYALPYLVDGYRPPKSEVERIVGLTRLGTLAFRGLDLLQSAPKDESWATQLRLTRQYLSQLKEAAITQGSALLVLVIPLREDIGAPGEQYLAAIDLLQELDIPFMDTIDLFDPILDYAPPPDVHWNNSGHQKAGAYLGKCVAAFFASGSFDDCESVFVGSG